ncbi:hypothetical protein SVAN01_00979 [Stagonosporopsis vannaccii]|nr:hypothetical protein SVAN01_00979 [Stagonosporopsis vannaccii]
MKLKQVTVEPGNGAASDRKRDRSSSGDMDDGYPLERKAKLGVQPIRTTPARDAFTSVMKSCLTSTAAGATTHRNEHTQQADKPPIQWVMHDTKSSTKYSVVLDPDGPESWTRETTTMQSYTSIYIKNSIKVVTIFTTDAVSAEEVPKRVKRETEWDALTVQERAEFKDDFVEYLISKTMD